MCLLPTFLKKRILKFLQIKLGGILKSGSQRKCSENTTIFSTLIKGMPRRHVKKMSGHHSKVSCKRFGLCHATLSPGPQTQYDFFFLKEHTFFDEPLFSQDWYFVSKTVLTYCEPILFQQSRKTFEILG